MKKLVSIILSLMLLALLTSCNSTENNSTDEESDFMTDIDNAGYDDDFYQADEDSIEPDEDVADSDQDIIYPDEDPTALSFKTRPHGVTRWDETYSYFIRCESKTNSPTVITVSKDDTCKGSIDSNTYTFTPTLKNLPEGRCVISVQCSDGTNGIIQKTNIRIPNPFELPGPVKETVYPAISWSNSQRGIFVYEQQLFATNKALDSITLLDEDLPDTMITYSSDDFFYYVSKDKQHITRTDGTSENTVAEYIPDITGIKYIYLVADDDSILFESDGENVGDVSILLYNPAENTTLPIDIPDDIELDQYRRNFALCDEDSCIFSESEYPVLILDISAKTIEPVCPISPAPSSIVYGFINKKIYYRYNSEECLTSLDISTCTEEKIGNCEETYTYSLNSRYSTRQKFFNILERGSDKTEITVITSHGDTKSATFNGNTYYGSYIKTQDGVHLYNIHNYFHTTTDPYNCLEILNLEDGSVITPDLTCNPSNVFSWFSFFGEASVFKNLYGMLDPQFFEVNNDGTYLKKAMIAKEAQPSSGEYTLSTESISDKNDLLILDTSGSQQIFKTDGTPENTEYFRNTFGKIISITDKYVVTYLEFIHNCQNSFANIYSLETGELIFSTVASPYLKQINPHVDPEPCAGATSYNLTIGKVSFFGISNSKGGYYLWSTNGTAAGTINYGISLSGNLTVNQNVFSDSNNGIYLNIGNTYYYIDESGNSAIDTELHGYSGLGTADDKFIAYKLSYGKIKAIVELKEGKIIKEILPTGKTSYSNISMSGKRIEMLEIVKPEEGNDEITNILYFPDGDLTNKPVRKKLFDGSYNSVSNVLEENDTLFYSIPLSGDISKSMIGVIFNDDDSSINTLKSFLYYNDDNESYDDFTAMTIVKNKFIFNQDNFLMSTSYKNSKIFPFKLVETKGYSKYLGKSFSGEAVIQQSIILIITDGSIENTRIITQSTYSYDIMWNGWILKKNNTFISEESNNGFEDIPIPTDTQTASNYSVAGQNIYFIGTETEEEKNVFIYHLPETETDIKN